jgi:hypothetical protein
MNTQTINPLFTEPREPKDIDLVKCIRDLLVESGLNQQVIIAFDTNEDIINASAMRPEAQRFILNRFWHSQLIGFGVKTIEHRYCLLPTGDHSWWLKIFREKILPMCIELRLPIVLT